MSFLGEIKRRKVFQVAAVYAVVAWLLIQIVDVVSAPLNLPIWLDSVVIILLAVGFPIAVILAWAFDLTPGGVVKDQGTNVTAQSSGRRIEYVLFGLLVVAVGWLVYQDIAPSTSPTVADTSPALDLVESEPQPGVLPNSIAVLPFENLSPDPDNAYFAAGIHESTLNQLAKIHDLVVISRTSVMQYDNDRPPIPEIAEALNVATIMEGSVRYADGRVLITAQLIDGQTDAHLWSDEFNRDLADVFAVQAEVAEHIAMAMQVQLLPEEQARIANRPTASTEAYQHYLHALSFPSPFIFPQYMSAKRESLERAIAADPDFAEAYMELAWDYYSERKRDIAVEYAQKAIELDPTLGRAFLVLGIIYEQFYVRQDEARAAYKRAAELGPNDPFILMSHGRRSAEQSGEYAEAIRSGERAVAIDPNDAGLHDQLGFIYLRAGDLPEAVRYISEAIRLDPGVYLDYLNLATVEYLNGDLSVTRENLDRAVQIMASGSTQRVGYLGYLYGLLGEPDKAANLLARLEELNTDRQSDNQLPLGWAVLGTGDKERALRQWTITVNGYLEENRRVSPGRISRFRDNWLNDPMLEEPEFLELRRRLGYKG
jgi:TolB-like protein/Tfp pilus assembly protein PilF